MKTPATLRPFDFMTTFWGQRYREYFVDLCLPSLLAPNNLPLLRAEDGHRFLIATTMSDWEEIEHLPIMDRMRPHATPVWIDVSRPSQDALTDGNAGYTATIAHLHRCLKKLFEAAYSRRAYGSQVFPDNIFSDGMIAALTKRIQQGYQLVIAQAMREIEEDVLDHLRSHGYLSSETRLSATGGALNIPQRVMADLVIRHLHPEMLLYDQNKPVQPFPLPIRYWRVRENRGILMHSFLTGLIALVDFDAVPANHADCLDRGDIEKHYVSQNFTDWGGVHVVQDSDEFAFLALTPKAVNRAPPLQEGLRGLEWTSKWRRLANIRASMRHFAGVERDPFKRDLFRIPIRWHSTELDDIWMEEEQKVEQQISRSVGDYYVISKPPNRNQFPSSHTLIDYYIIASTFFIRVSSIAGRNLKNLVELGRRLWLLLCGNAAAKHWLIWRIHVSWRQLRGYTSHPPRPDFL